MLCQDHRVFLVIYKAIELKFSRNLWKGKDGSALRANIKHILGYFMQAKWNVD